MVEQDEPWLEGSTYYLIPLSNFSSYGFLRGLPMTFCEYFASLSYQLLTFFNYSPSELKAILYCDLCSMDVHPSRELVASGQRAGRNRKTQAHIRIWSTETLLTLYVFGMGEFEIGVAAVAFSQLVSHY